MAHPIQTYRSNGAPRISAVFDAGVSGVHCVLRLAIALLGSPLPLAQIGALAVAGVAITVMNLLRADKGRHCVKSDGRLGAAPSDIWLCLRAQTPLETIGEE